MATDIERPVISIAGEKRRYRESKKPSRTFLSFRSSPTTKTPLFISLHPKLTLSFSLQISKMDNNNNFDPRDPADGYSDKSYALSGKIMLSAVVILFFVVVLMVCLHLYARWYLFRARRRHARRNRTRRTHLIFYVDPANPITSTANRGLEESVLKSLPVFVYSSKTHQDSMDCAVCLSEFEENESGRVLPKCNHSFHLDCIDMWFHSHSTCPLCRSTVEPDLEETGNPVVVSVSEPGEPSSELCDTCIHDDSVGTSSSSKRRDMLSVSIEVPARNLNDGFGGGGGDELNQSSSSSFRSPMSRVLSLKRMLSRDRRAVPSPSPSSASCCGSVAELDIERGRETQ